MRVWFSYDDMVLIWWGYGFHMMRVWSSWWYGPHEGMVLIWWEYGSHMMMVWSSWGYGPHMVLIMMIVRQTIKHTFWRASRLEDMGLVNSHMWSPGVYTCWEVLNTSLHLYTPSYTHSHQSHISQSPLSPPLTHSIAVEQEHSMGTAILFQSKIKWMHTVEILCWLLWTHGNITRMGFGISLQSHIYACHHSSLVTINH